MAVYLVWCVLSAFAAPDQALAWDNTEAAAKIVIPILIGLSLIDSAAQLRQLAWVIVLSQGYLALEFNTSYYQGFDRLAAVGFAGMDEKTVAASMAVDAALALFLGLHEKRPAFKVIAFVLAALMLHVPMFALSRGGMLALLVTGTLVVWFVPKRPVHIMVVACVIALGFGLAGPDVQQAFSTIFASEGDRDWSAESRLVLWGQAWETMLQRPILGIGPRHWQLWSQSVYDWQAPKEVHNTWFQAGAELGFPGVIALASFFLFTIVRLIPLARGRIADAQPYENNIARMVVCALVAFLIASQFITLYGVETPFYAALLGLGVLKLRSEKSRSEKAETTERIRDEATTFSGTGPR